MTLDSQALAKRGEEHRLKKDYDRAIADFSEAIRLNPNYSWAFGMRGLTYHLKKDYDRAIADFSEAIRLEPTAWRFKVRGDAFRRKADGIKTEKGKSEKRKLYDQAIIDITESIRLDPKDSESFARRSQAHIGNGNHVHQFADLNEAIRIDPNYEFALSELGNIYSHRFRNACEAIVGGTDLWAAVHYRGKEWTDVTGNALKWGLEEKTITWRDRYSLFRTLATAAELVVNNKFGKEDFRSMLAASLEHTKAWMRSLAWPKFYGKVLVDWWKEYGPIFDAISANSGTLDQWYVNKDGQSHGPYSSADICNFLNNENISIDDEIARIDLLKAKKLRDLGKEECNRTAGQRAVYEAVSSIRSTRRTQSIKNFLCGTGKILGGAALITGMVALHIMNETAKHAGAPPGYIFCLKCREAVKITASVCPHCREDPTSPF